MAGRGTDIQLGGNLDMRLAVELANVEDPAERERITAQIRAEIERDKEIVKQAGGLFVIGTERHESRRIDNRFAAVPAVRATPAPPSSSSAWTTT